MAKIGLEPLWLFFPYKASLGRGEVKESVGVQEKIEEDSNISGLLGQFVIFYYFSTEVTVLIHQRTVVCFFPHLFVFIFIPTLGNTTGGLSWRNFQLPVAPIRVPSVTPN